MAHGRVAQKSRKGGENHDEGSCAGGLFRIKPQPHKSRDNKVSPAHSQQTSKISGDSAHGGPGPYLLAMRALNFFLFALKKSIMDPAKTRKPTKSHKRVSRETNLVL